MTLANAINSAYDMAIGGFVNGEKFTRAQFAEMVSKIMQCGDDCVFQLALPDGWWFCKIISGSWGYDLIVPDTREDEAGIIAKLTEV